MIFLVQFGVNKHYGLVQFCYSLKIILVLIYSKLLLKLCDYLYKQRTTTKKITAKMVRNITERNREMLKQAKEERLDFT